MPTLIFFQGGRLPTLLIRAGAHGLAASESRHCGAVLWRGAVDLFP